MVTGFTVGLPSRVCPFLSCGNVERSIASAYCVFFPEGKEEFEKMGDARMRGTSGPASMLVVLPSKVSAMGTSTVGMMVVPGCAGS